MNKKNACEQFEETDEMNELNGKLKQPCDTLDLDVKNLCISPQGSQPQHQSTPTNVCKTKKARPYSMYTGRTLVFDDPHFENKHHTPKSSSSSLSVTGNSHRKPYQSNPTRIRTNGINYCDLNQLFILICFVLETSNLVRVRNSTLGKSAPSLSVSFV